MSARLQLPRVVMFELLAQLIMLSRKSLGMPTVDAARQTGEPAGARVVNGEVGGYPEFGQLRGRDRPARGHYGVESV